MDTQMTDVEREKKEQKKMTDEYFGEDLKDNQDSSFFLVDGVDTSFHIYIRNVSQALLDRLNLSQQDVADKLNINKSYISRTFNGLQIPPLKTRIAIARILKTDSSVLWRVEHLSEIKQIIKSQKENA